jgi:hypothetical protein
VIAMPTCPRRLLRAAARPAAALTLTAALGAPVGAQPACAAGALAGYLSPGFQCQLAGWRFFDFTFDADAAAVPGTSAAAPDPLGTTSVLTPFAGLDALGRQTFGFDFSGFATVATAEPGATTGPGAGAIAGAGLAFQAESIDPSDVISHTRLDYLLEGTKTTPDPTTLVSLVQGLAGPTLTGTGAQCMAVVDVLTGPGGGPRSAEHACLSPVQNSLRPILNVGSNAFQSLDPLDAGGTTRARIDRITFVVPGVTQVVPEPATLALTGGGLLALAGLARRRRG